MLDGVVRLALERGAAGQVGDDGDGREDAGREDEVLAAKHALLAAVDGDLDGVLARAGVAVGAGDGGVAEHVGAHDAAVLVDPVGDGVAVEEPGPVAGELEKGKVVAVDGRVRLDGRVPAAPSVAWTGGFFDDDILDADLLQPSGKLNSGLS